MWSSRCIALITTGFILIVIVGLGPLTPWSTPGMSTTSNYEGGTASVSLEDNPPPLVLRPEKFGSNDYILVTNSFSLRVDSVSGNPRVNYKISIPELGYSGITIHNIDEESVGDTIEISGPEAEFDSSRIMNSTYNGRVELILRGENHPKTILNRSIKIDVIDP